MHLLVQAMKRSKTSPLAFVEALMHFKEGKKDVQTGLFEHTMEVTDVLKNRFGILHGGVTATFIDTAMGATVLSLTGSTNGAVTINLKVDFITPAQSGRLTAMTEVIREGKTIIVLQTRVYDEEQAIVATATGTFYRLRHRSFIDRIRREM